LKFNISKGEDDTLLQLAAYFVTVAQQVIETGKRFSVALSGGSSPKKLYEILAADPFKTKIDWTKVDFFFGDERNVPQTDKDSNYLMAKRAMFEPLNIDAAQVFAVDTSLVPTEAAKNYAEVIGKYFGDKEWRFDLVLLGLGDNSHTASLFPNTSVLHDKTVGVKEVWLTDQQVFRITLTAPLINQAERIAYLVYGKGKALAVHHVIEDARDIENYPAQLIENVNGELIWFLDEAAASNLQNSKTAS
jgi:6-phosphogluconolactonase